MRTKNILNHPFNKNNNSNELKKTSNKKHKKKITHIYINNLEIVIFKIYKLKL